MAVVYLGTLKVQNGAKSFKEVLQLYCKSQHLNSSKREAKGEAISNAVDREEKKLHNYSSFSATVCS